MLRGDWQRPGYGHISEHIITSVLCESANAHKRAIWLLEYIVDTASRLVFGAFQRRVQAFGNCNLMSSMRN